MARARLSGNRLGKLTGKSQAYWWRRLSGETPFDVDDLSTVADLLGVEVVTFFGVERRNPRPDGPDGGSTVGHPVGCRCDACARRDSNPQPSDP